ncbi:hypothetical protein SDC9_88811 [bioreactor metagenome]|uniref:SH3b domain-containing protein n=2 Tax=root TaxID=1 RepID=A0A644ZMI0_9ZZZZ
MRLKKYCSILVTTLLITSSSLSAFADSKTDDIANLSLENNLSTSNVEAKTVTAFINANGVRMRKGPGTSYAVIATLNKGTMVHKTGVIRHANGYFWQSITYNGKDGWVVLDYVS